MLMFIVDTLSLEKLELCLPGIHRACVVRIQSRNTMVQWKALACHVLILQHKFLGAGENGQTIISRAIGQSSYGLHPPLYHNLITSDEL